MSYDPRPTTWEKAAAVALVIASGIVSVFTLTAIFGMILGYL